MNKPPLINCLNLTKSYLLGEVTVEALLDINLCIDYGEHVAIVGPSGSGKSTCMNILGCLDTPTQGKYFLEGIDISTLKRNQLALIRNKKIGFIFQSFNLLPYASALENVALPLTYGGMQFKEAKHRARAWLVKVGLEHRLHHMPNELSGGQRQRVAIARALVTEPDLLLADEPTGNLDTKTGQEIMGLFASIIKQGKTLIVVTHDLEVAHQAARVVYMRDGKIVESQQN